MMLVLLLAVATGCPHEWGRGGTIDMALEKDMREYYRKKNCNLGTEEWERKCKGYKRKPSWEKKECPEDCRPLEDGN
jgi:hypothetical protein